MKTYSFPMQIHLLNERFRQQQQVRLLRATHERCDA